MRVGDDRKQSCENRFICTPMNVCTVQTVQTVQMLLTDRYGNLAGMLDSHSGWREPV